LLTLGFLKNYQVNWKFWLLFSTAHVICIHMYSFSTKYVLGYILAYCLQSHRVTMILGLIFCHKKNHRSRDSISRQPCFFRNYIRTVKRSGKQEYPGNWVSDAQVTFAVLPMYLHAWNFPDFMNIYLYFSFQHTNNAY
jgi:hypothetical protein